MSNGPIPGRPAPGRPAPGQGDEEDGLRRAIAEHATWLTVERGLRPNTLSAYRRDLDAYVAFLRGRGIADPQDVDAGVVRDYVALRSAPDDEGRAPAPATVARSLVSVRSLHQFLVDEGMVGHDPTEDVRAPKVPAGIPKALSEDDVLALLESVEGRDPRAIRDRTMLEVLYASGMRISELVGIDRADIDLEGSLVRVLGKGAKERIVPIGRPAREAVEDYLRSARPELERSGPGARGAGARGAGDALFLNARGGRISRQSCWAVVRTAGTRAGLGDRVHPHVLRHSCATHLLDHGADIRVVQEVLGHASVSTTQVYTLVSAERLRAVYETAHPRARV